MPRRGWLGPGEAFPLAYSAALLVILLALSAITEDEPCRVDDLLSASRGLGDLRRYASGQVTLQQHYSCLVSALHRFSRCTRRDSENVVPGDAVSHCAHAPMPVGPRR